mgnify:FL=1
MPPPDKKMSAKAKVNGMFKLTDQHRINLPEEAVVYIIRPELDDL